MDENLISKLIEQRNASFNTFREKLNRTSDIMADTDDAISDSYDTIQASNLAVQKALQSTQVEVAEALKIADQARENKKEIASTFGPLARIRALFGDEKYDVDYQNAVIQDATADASDALQRMDLLVQTEKLTSINETVTLDKINALRTDSLQNANIAQQELATHQAQIDSLRTDIKAKIQGASLADLQKWAKDPKSAPSELFGRAGLINGEIKARQSTDLDLKAKLTSQRITERAEAASTISTEDLNKIIEGKPVNTPEAKYITRAVAIEIANTRKERNLGLITMEQGVELNSVKLREEGLKRFVASTNEFEINKLIEQAGPSGRVKVGNVVFERDELRSLRTIIVQREAQQVKTSIETQETMIEVGTTAQKALTTYANLSEVGASDPQLTQEVDLLSKQLQGYTELADSEKNSAGTVLAAIEAMKSTADKLKATTEARVAKHLESLGDTEKPITKEWLESSNHRISSAENAQLYASTALTPHFGLNKDPILGDTTAEFAQTLADARSDIYTPTIQLTGPQANLTNIPASTPKDQQAVIIEKGLKGMTHVYKNSQGEEIILRGMDAAHRKVIEATGDQSQILAVRALAAGQGDQIKTDAWRKYGKHVLTFFDNEGEPKAEIVTANNRVDSQKLATKLAMLTYQLQAENQIPAGVDLGLLFSREIAAQGKNILDTYEPPTVQAAATYKLLYENDATHVWMDAANAQASVYAELSNAVRAQISQESDQENAFNAQLSTVINKVGPDGPQEFITDFQQLRPATPTKDAAEKAGQNWWDKFGDH